MCDAIAPENWAFQIAFNSFQPPARNKNWSNYQEYTIIMLDSSAADLGCCYKYSCPLNAVPSLVHIVSSKLLSRACKLPTSLQCDHLCSQRQTFVHGFFYSLRYIYHLLQIFLSSSRDCSWVLQIGRDHG